MCVAGKHESGSALLREAEHSIGIVGEHDKRNPSWSARGTTHGIDGILERITNSADGKLPA